MKFIFIFLFLASPFSLYSFSYDTEFLGIDDTQVLQKCKSASYTITHKEKQPLASLAALKQRAESDIKRFYQVCSYYGYLDPSIDYTIVRTTVPKVIFEIHLGPQFTLEQFNFFPEEILEKISIDLPKGKPAQTEEILKLEDFVLLKLKNQGYAFAEPLQKKVVADKETKKVSITLSFALHEELRFGKTDIQGFKDTHPRWIRKHLLYKEGDLFAENLLELSQQRLEKTGHFTSVLFEQEEEQVQNGKLPITLHLQEGKQKSIGAGAGYTTYKGPGVSFSWENRHFRGIGDHIGCSIHLYRRFQDIKLFHKKHHIGFYDQNLLTQFQLEKADTPGFRSKIHSLSSIFDRQMNEHKNYFFGGKIESLHSESSEGTMTYYLLKTPLGFKWTTAQDIFDPKEGVSLQVKLTPSFQTIVPRFSYLTHMTTGAFYLTPFNDQFTLATKVSFGNILGASQYKIPKPDRFFSGTENTLRGYRYFSISPLNEKNKPIGGRSLLTGTLEGRFRTKSGLGWVIFYDVGTVYSANFPDLSQKQFHSGGIGARYDTPIGLFRLDLAVPFSKRSIDPHFQIYFSIGQSF